MNGRILWVMKLYWNIWDFLLVYQCMRWSKCSGFTGLESFLWTILFRVSVHIFNIMDDHLSSKDAFESINFELWVLCLIYLSSNGKHSEIRIGTYNECSRKVKLNYFWAKRGKSNNGSAFQILMWSECEIHFMFVIRHSISIPTVQVLNADDRFEINKSDSRFEFYVLIQVIRQIYDTL